ncbi:MAG: phosphoribosyltransferase family protein, partial [Acidimicrobiales bacterium]
MLFANREDAGRRLAAELDHLRGGDVVVVGLPRGGVPVGLEVARHLGAPLDVIVVRKLGVPFQPELGMGAIGEGGVRVLNEEVISAAGVGDGALADVERRERAELERRARRFRGDRPMVPLAGRTVVVVDDGIATGSTARAACQAARAHGASRVVLAVPVAPPGWTARFAGDADELACVATPQPFHAIGQWYRDFSQTSDAEVLACLERAAPAATARDEEVEVDAGPVRLAGHLTVPPAAGGGIVVFAHGSGSSRHSPRNRVVAETLRGAGLGTLLFDLLTPDEEGDRANVFDIGLLAERLLAATRWLRDRPEGRRAAVGWFGASTGAAAALW